MVIVVGADKLGKITTLLKDRGFANLKHITGRQPKTQKSMPVSTAHAELMVLFTDFVGHNVMHNYRKRAREQKIPFIACRRSVCDLAKCLDKCGFTC
ncbi:DUF2325 domain-containing protein [Candidatus Parabeggiatoa sp. HSG14]|uniref:DUF2325 domain-containing protein n=1 Tax=Candidatus Parabeggiatoa sp. HSG14 TaxID=3055593 RepID=UPI0025A7F8AF|nr:DUF2325 domain-containing protein [Thiotrichales bacterium HSG14]